MTTFPDRIELDTGSQVRVSAQGWATGSIDTDDPAEARQLAAWLLDYADHIDPDGADPALELSDDERAQASDWCTGFHFDDELVVERIVRHVLRNRPPTN